MEIFWIWWLQWLFRHYTLAKAHWTHQFRWMHFILCGLCL
jgi:hypothetical protein